MNYTNKLLKRTSIIFIFSIIAAFIGYLFRMVLARSLTPADYGLFFAVFTFISFLNIFRNFGLTQALVKYIPEFQVNKQLKEIKNSVIISTGTNLLSAVVIATILILLSDFLSKNYFKNELAAPIIILFSLIMIVSVFKQNLRKLFHAFQKMFYFSFMYFIENLLILIIVLILIYFNFKVFSPVYAYLIAYILLFVLFFPLFLRIYPFFKYKFEFSKTLTKKMFTFGLPLMISSIGSFIILYTDTLILTYFTNLTEVGIYNVVVPTVALLKFFGKSVRDVLFPMVSELKSKKFDNYIKKGAVIIQKYSFIIVIPAALSIFSFPKLILKLLFGQEYIAGAQTLQVLVIGIIFIIIGTINLSFLEGIGRPKTVAKIIIFAAIFNFITNLYFIPVFGMLGAAITSFMSYFLILIFSIIYLGQIIKIKVDWTNWIKIFVAGAVFVFLISAFKNLLDFNVYVEAIMSILFSGAVYILLLFLLKITSVREVKELFLNKLNL